jgi:hypothetical protein
MPYSNTDFRPPEALDELDPQLRELDRYLLLDGVVWRRRLPDPDAAAHHAVARLQPPDPRATARSAPLRATSYPLAATSPSPPHGAPRFDRRRGLTAVAAMIAVVALMGALLHGLVGGRQATTATTHTPHPSVSAAPASPTPSETFSIPGSAWSAVPGFDGKGDVAFVSPQVAYAYTTQDAPGYNPATPSKFAPPPTYILQTTQDGGATWQTLPLPVAQPQGGQASDYSIVNIFTQPCSCANNAIVYITLHLLTAALCQPYGSYSKSGGDCVVQFSSGDGGQTWQRLQLPAVSPSEPGDPILTGHFIYEDKYVYSTIQDFCDCSGTPASPRIVGSVEGSGPWKTVDDALLAKGLGADFVDGAGSTLFAVVEPVDPNSNQPLSGNPPYTPGHLQLYRADLAWSGGQWTLVGDLPHNSIDSFRVSTDIGSQPPSTVLYATSSFDATAPNAQATRLPTPVVEYSDNLGQSWKSAPTDGIPAGYAVQGSASNSEIGPIPATLADGAALVFFTAGQDTTIFAWKPGDASWHAEGGAFSASPILSLYVQTQNGSTGQPVPYIFDLTTGSGLLRCQLT